MSDYKPGDIVDGHIKVLKNGAGYDLDRGRISHGPGTHFPDPNCITSARATELAAISHEVRQEKVEARLLKEIAAIDPDLPTIAVPDDAWAAIVGRQGILAWTADGRASTAAASFVGRAAGYLVDKVAQLALAIQVNVVPQAMDDEEW